MAKVNCIDVSVYQKNADFAKAKADGISAVIIRAGYGREASQKDSLFETHYKNAKAAGLKIGAYWYSYADSEADAEREAAACLACVKGKSFDLPIYFDMEDDSQTKYSKAALTRFAKAFCEKIKKGGYRAGVYANLNWFNNYLDYSELKKSYSIWLAQYNSVNQLDCDIWQNSSSGKISGISGNVDTNVIFNSRVVSEKKTAKATEASVAKTVKIPDVEYRVRAGGKWYPAVKNLSDYAGVKGKAITDVAVKVSKGAVKYRVHIKGGKWLPWVTGYSTTDSVNGYAGNGQAVDAIEVYYTTPSDLRKALGYALRAKYRVSPIESDYYSYQYDSEKSNSQDGYAGALGTSIDRLQITLSK